VRIRFPAVLSVGALAAPTHAQKVPTCVRVEGGTTDEAELSRLVESEVDRHRTHRTATEGCRVSLRVELIEVSGQRFLTGRVGGEVPQRVRVEGTSGKALEAAVVELLRVVLGTDPVTLHVPGDRSGLEEKALALRDHGRSTLDFAVVETATLLEGRVAFTPGLSLGYSREIVDLQVGLEFFGAQTLTSHTDRLELDTYVALRAVLTHFFSETADTSGFVGVSFGAGHQRFSGPAREADGRGFHHVTGPLLGARAGVELFRTTALRGHAFGEALLPLFAADDEETGVVHAYTPSLLLGAGIRF